MNQKLGVLFCCFLSLGLAPCANAADSVLRYALKQGLAQGALLLKARKIPALLKDPLQPESVKRSLLLTQEILAFARKVPMDVGAAYQAYVELEHDWVTQVVIAAYRDRLEVRDFHFPIMGDFPYKGFFDEDDAKKEEAELARDFDVFRRKAPAFSSLGWFSDPVTSNLIREDEFLIETLFHELVHRNFYFDDQSDFNEAFATWFSYQAAKDFLKTSVNVPDKAAVQSELQESIEFDGEITDFLSEVIREGNRFYQRRKVSERGEYFSWIKNCLKQYPALKKFERLEWNNAVIMSFSTYTRLIPAIEEYAQKNNLSYGAFLALIMKRKSAIVPEIEKLVKENQAKKCVPGSP